jgi:carbonic anhydrase
MFLLLLVHSSTAWDYSHQGADWPDTCANGTHQSPIAIDSSSVTLSRPHDSLEHISLAFSFSPLNATGAFTRSAYKISGFFGELTAHKPNHQDQAASQWNNSAEIRQFHFHAPSEHTLNGKSYALEMHVVMQDVRQSFSYVVLGVLFSLGENNAFLDSVISAQKTETIIDLGQLLENVNVNEFYTYQGSLTTPPCTEGVLWLVSNTPQTLSAGQLEFFSSHWAENVDFANGNGNNRAVQPLNSRALVYNSFSVIVALGLALLII